MRTLGKELSLLLRLGIIMEIHKPKAAHSWREFLIEIGTIVCGILIALGLEQTIEAVHWNEQVKRTDEAMQAELKKDFGFAYGRRVIGACINDRIAYLRDKLLEPGPKWAAASLNTIDSGFYQKDVIAPVIRVPWKPWRMEAWQTALSSGVLNHMEPERVAVYARLYDQVGLLKQIQDNEKAALHQVGGLAFSRNLTGSERTAYLDRLETISYQAHSMFGASGQLIHAPFLPGSDGFHVTEADAASSVRSMRAVYGACVTSEMVPRPNDPDSTKWFTSP